jgi:hypothetical protein
MSINFNFRLIKFLKIYYQIEKFILKNSSMHENLTKYVLQFSGNDLFKKCCQHLNVN